MNKSLFVAAAGVTLGSYGRLAVAQPTAVQPPARASLTVQTDLPGKAISSDLFGIFFEDINYAADGGLYAELVQNRSFEYSREDNRAWNALTSWELVTRGGGTGGVENQRATPLNANNPHYAVLTVEQGGEGVGIANSGFDGIALKQGEQYNLSFFARQMSPQATPLTVRLESATGTVYSQATFPRLAPTWTKYTATFLANASDPRARLVIMATNAGSVGLDMVSLFPAKTFRNRPNGLRADLAQTIADLKPRFIRFPGGCLAHGDGIDNIYHWKQTTGPIEERKAQPNIWRYHQTTGLGYFEYFQFCDDIGAKPLPVVAAGVSCQNSNGKPGTGQECIPMSQMPQYIQDILDLIEYANGPATSQWGARRAAAGHAAPFRLQYLGVGNEDAQTPEFRERFKMIHDAVRAKHPEITVIGTAGPFHSGFDFDEGWKFTKEQNVAMVDEHYYEAPEWFLRNVNRYDSYNRAEGKVYLGEYASRGNTLFNALAEAAYMAGLEKNGDVVHLASYAPLLAKAGHTQWNPDLIYFDNTSITPSVNYYVQQLYGQNTGDRYLSNTLAYTPPTTPPLVIPSGVFLGTWNTQAQFDDVKVESNAPAAGNAALLNESFAAATPRWSGQVGQWSLADGAYTQTANDQPALTRVVMPEGTATKDGYTYTLRARKTGGSEGFLIGFGAQDAENNYWWNIGGWNNTSHAIQKMSRGSVRNVVGGMVPGRIETNRWYNIKIVVAGDRIQCFLDGKLIHNVVDDENAQAHRFVASTVKDRATGDLILKLVNVSPVTVQSDIKFDGAAQFNPEATQTVLTGAPSATNVRDPRNVLPTVSKVRVGRNFTYTAPPYSFTVIRVKPAGR